MFASVNHFDGLALFSVLSRRLCVSRHLNRRLGVNNSPGSSLTASLAPIVLLEHFDFNAHLSSFRRRVVRLVQIEDTQRRLKCLVSFPAESGGGGGRIVLELNGRSSPAGSGSC